MEASSMKKNKSVPNLKFSKQNSQIFFSTSEETNKRALFKNLFGAKSRDSKGNDSSVQASQRDNPTTQKTDYHSCRNLNKIMSEPAGSFEDDSNTNVSIFKKISLRLSGSKKNKQKLQGKDSFYVNKDIKTLSQQNLDSENVFDENKVEDSEIIPNSGFVRQRKAQMSMRRAFGIYEDIEQFQEDLSFQTYQKPNDDGYLEQLHELVKNDDSELMEDSISSKNFISFVNDPNSELYLPMKVTQDVNSSSDIKPPSPKVKGSDHSCLEKRCSDLLKDNENLCYDATLKPDIYANQLREQARRLSLSKSSNFFKKKQNKSYVGRVESLESENSRENREALRFICNQTVDSYQLNESLIGIPNEVQSPDYLKFQNDGIISQSNLPLNDAPSREETSLQFESMNPNMDTICSPSLSAEDDIQPITQSSSKHFELDSSRSSNANQLSQSYVSNLRSETAYDEVFHSETSRNSKSTFLNKKFAPVSFTPGSSYSSDIVNNTMLSNGNATERNISSRTRRKRHPVSTEECFSNIKTENFSLELKSAAELQIDASSDNHVQAHVPAKGKMLKNLSEGDTPEIVKSFEWKNNKIRRMSVEKRGKFLEEKECEEFAITLAEKLKLVDPQLSNILSTKHKSILDHVPTLTNVCYCPNENEDTLKISELQAKSHNKISKSKAKNCLVTVDQEKNEMENMLVKKIEVLCQEKISLERKIVKNNDFGKEASESLSDYLDKKQVEKFLTLAQEAEKVMKLILKLSNMLARVEESYFNLPHNSTDKEKAILHNKAESLKLKLNEAKLIKESVDSKYEQMLSILHVRLPSSVTKNFDGFLSAKNLLMIDLEELNNEIRLAQTQLHSLRSTMIKNSVGTTC